MITFEERIIIDAPINRCFDLSRSVEVHLVGNIRSGEQTIASGGVTAGLVGLSQRVTWRRWLPLPVPRMARGRSRTRRLLAQAENRCII